MRNSKRQRLLRVKHNLDKVCAARMLLGAPAMVMPTMVLFLMGCGLSLGDIIRLQAVFQVAWALLEVPSGYVADLIGRKFTLVAAAVLYTGGYALYSIGSGFSDFVLPEVMLAAALALFSGADEALCYDSLRELKSAHRFKPYWGLAGFVQMLGMAGFALANIGLATQNLRWPLYATAAVVSLAIPITLWLDEPRRKKPNADGEQHAAGGHVRALYQIVVQCSYRDKKLGWLIVYAALLSAFLGVGVWFYQPYMELAEIDIVWFGVVFAVFNVVAAFTSLASNCLSKACSEKISLLLPLGALVMSYLLLGSTVAWWGLGFIFLQQFVRGYQQVVFSAAINAAIGEQARATTLSLKNLLGRILQSGILVGVAKLSDSIGLLDTIEVVGAALLLTGTVVFIFRPEK